jgi:hypothetical protein
MSEPVSGLAAVEGMDTAKRAHHPDSPSSLQASEACPGFENEQRESLASAAGTLQHKATETRDLSILENEEQVRAVQDCIAFEDELIAWHTERTGTPPTVIREKYLSVGDDIVRASDGTKFTGVTGGFPDTLIVSSDRKLVDIPDWKFGRIPVEPTKNNRQGQSYALGAAYLVPEAELFRVTFFPPHQGFTRQEIEEKYQHVFSRAELAGHETAIRTIVARKHRVAAEIARDEWSSCTPKMDLCMWCARKGVCQPLHAVVLKPAEKHPNFVVPATVNHLELTRPEQFKLAFRWANQLDLIVKAVKKRCVDAVTTEDLDLGDDMRLVKRTERKVNSVQGVIDMAAQHGLAPSEIIELLTAPITKLEDAIKAKAARGEGAAAVRAFRADLEEHGITEPGTPVYYLQEVKSPADKKTIEITTS